MMEKLIRYFVLLPLVFLTTRLSAQFDQREGRIVNDGYPGGIIEAKNLEKSSVVEGSFFINDYWSVGDVLLYNGKAIKSLPLKYNLRDEMLLLLDKNQISRFIRDDQIEKFEWFDGEKKKNILFINGLHYKLNGVPLAGFFEIVCEGPVELLLYRTLEIEKGYYSITHDAGQMNDEYLIKDIQYLASEKELFEVKNKKDFYHYFGEDSEKIKSFIKDNNLRIKKTEELAKVIDYYNAMIDE
jgi:hypothetical protein